MTKREIILKKSKKILEIMGRLSITELENLVSYHNKKYFRDNNPEISDEAFDKLVETLRFKNPRAAVLKYIGALSLSAQINHSSPMLSLDKCYDDENFFKWAKNIRGDFIAMPKIDGVACSLKYDFQGYLSQAATRGNGYVGENITKNALMIQDIPTKIAQANLEIRGEVYLSLSNFNKFYAQEFANPRNLAAGALKQKDPQKTKDYNLKFFPYDIKNSQIKTEKGKFELLANLGFSMMPWEKVVNNNLAHKNYIKFQKLKNNLDFEIDGVVYRANEIAEQERLGETAHHPRYALAYKFQGESAQSEIVDIIWSAARTGIISPVLEIRPVFVSGASISRVSLHNYSRFLELEICENSRVEITRRGGVIPHVERVLARSGNKLQPPKNCPSCGGPVIIDGEFLSCKNPEFCADTIISKIIYFCHVLDIAGLGEKIIKKLYEQNLVKNYHDIFKLAKNDLVKLDRMGDKLASNLLQQIKSKQEVSLELFLQALGIPEVGPHVAQILVENFSTLAKIREITPDQIINIHGIGERISESLVLYMNTHKQEINNLLKFIKIKPQDSRDIKPDKDNLFFGKKIVFTGKMALLERKKAQKLVKNLGGHTPGAVSFNIDFLVIGDENSALLGNSKKSTKHKLAEKLVSQGSKIKIISEKEFLKLAT